jgi:hypothetical protein
MGPQGANHSQGGLGATRRLSNAPANPSATAAHCTSSPTLPSDMTQTRMAGAFYE